MHVSSVELLAALRGSGLRLTKTRRAICGVLAEAHDDHLTATDLHQWVERAIGGRVDQSTIYRTIDVLEEAGHLHHVHFGHGPGVIHLSQHSQHHHLVCEVCGRTVDLPVIELLPMFSQLEGEHGFVMGSVHFALVGRCLSCP